MAMRKFHSVAPDSSASEDDTTFSATRTRRVRPPRAASVRTQTHPKTAVKKSLFEDDDSSLSDFEDLSADESAVSGEEQQTYTKAENDETVWTGKFDSISGQKKLGLVSRALTVKLPKHAPVILPRLDVGLIRGTLAVPDRMLDMSLLRWLKSNDVVPIVKLWQKEVSRTKRLRGLMEETFDLAAYPWDSACDQILRHAMTKNLKGPTVSHLLTTARHAHTLVLNNRLWFEDNFIKYELEKEDKYRVVIAVLLTAWHDLQTNGNSSFFGILLRGPVAKSRTNITSKVLDMWYILDEERVVKHETQNKGAKTSANNEPVHEGMTAHNFMTSLSKHYTQSDDLKKAEETMASLNARIIDLQYDSAKQLSSLYEAQDTVAKLQAELVRSQAEIEELRRPRLEQRPEHDLPMDID